MDILYYLYQQSPKKSKSVRTSRKFFRKTNVKNWENVVSSLGCVY